MTSLLQLLRTKSIKQINNDNTPALGGNPFASGVCINVFTMNPNNPNSANSKVANVKLATGHIIHAHIPGEGHNLNQHSVVLISGGRSKDLPGIKYNIVSGNFDCGPVRGSSSSRSKYGVNSS